MFRVLAYRHTGNLGDAIQTIALCRLLGDRCVGVYRDEPYARRLLAAGQDDRLVINGWLGHYVPADRPVATFAGVHIGGEEARHVEWLRRSAGPVGTRDPYTQDLLMGSGIDAVLVGCATLTLPRYRGPRRGRYRIDVDGPPGATACSNRINEMPWPAQWRAAMDRLDTLRTAEIVYTNRLHVILPCLAFGTPVVCSLAALGRASEKHRLSLLGALGFRYGDDPVTMDVHAWAERYTRFLERALNISLTPVETPVCPRALPPHVLDRDAPAPVPVEASAQASTAPSSRHRGGGDKPSRIFYFCSGRGSYSYSHRDHEAHRHIEVLNRCGYDASLLCACEEGSSANGHHAHVPAVTLRALTGGYDDRDRSYDRDRDIVVFPDSAAKYAVIAGGRKVLWLRQSGPLLQTLAAGHALADHGVIGVIASSATLARQLTFAAPDFPVYVVRDALDASAFRFHAWTEKSPLIAIASNRQDTSAEVLRLLRTRARIGLNRLGAFTCMSTASATPDDVAAIFAKAALVLTLDADTDADAERITQAEAAASGCIVVAFDDGPSAAAAVPGVSRFARGDLPSIAAFIERVMDDFLEHRAPPETLSRPDISAAHDFTLQRQQDDLLSAWRHILAQQDHRFANSR